MVSKHGARTGTNKKTTENRKVHNISTSQQMQLAQLQTRGPAPGVLEGKVSALELQLCHRTPAGARGPLLTLRSEVTGLSRKKQLLQNQVLLSPLAQLTGTAKAAAGEAPALTICPGRSRTLKLFQGTQESLGSTYRFNKNPKWSIIIGS